MIYHHYKKCDIINTCWYVLKGYCCICIYFSTIRSFFVKKFYEIVPIVPYIRDTIVVKNSKIIHNCNYNDIIFKDNNYSYIVFKYVNETNNLIKIIHDQKNVIDIRNLEFSDLVSEISFIVITLKILDDKLKEIASYDITKYLKNNKESYYIVGAELFTPSFINWLSIYHIKKPIKNYEISILDNNINNITIMPQEYIRLNKMNYDIISDTKCEELT